MKHTAIQSANLSFNEDGTPVSREFDDVYFSNDNGLEETRYVFLAGNGIPARWETHPRRRFIVAESGFGTGLNFLTLWQAFDEFVSSTPQATLKQLHFISFEKFPLTRADLALAHGHWPELAEYARQLQAAWPAHLPGCHRLVLAQGRVTLDLWLGDINDTLSQLDDSTNQQVDAWFLDGFAPSKNPEMWTPNLFNAMARLARPGGTVATFTCAGFVRRGLQEAGFTMRKQKGFGRKREMLVGELPQAIDTPATTPWYARPASDTRSVSIIGGGVASALLSLALINRGWQVTLYCRDNAPAEGASGNRQGALYPLISHHNPALTGFFGAAFTFARRLYDSLPVQYDHDWCGVTQLGWDEKSQGKIDNMLALALPDEIAQGLDVQAAQQACGVATGCGGITYPLGGWLCPAQLTAGAIALAQQQGLHAYYGVELASFTREENGWALQFADGQTTTCSALVLANGHGISEFEQTAHLPVYPVSGQVSHIPATRVLGELRQVLCYDGYLTPVNPNNGHHCIGASYRRGETDTEYRDADQQANRQRLVDCFPDEQWPLSVDVSGNEARCGVRCASRDHLPVVGAVPDYDATLAQYAALHQHPELAANAPYYPDLFVMGALGSRGLCSAPLAAELLASQMSGEPLPLDSETLAALNPNRMWVRKLLKGKQVK